ncbi:hypothetical protein FOA52_003684 [Chlamydomonas sp. UWO 241]|nr:hypothetical protein FOA52_003684 [Chlamydomonas sp. UWO 241]
MDLTSLLLDESSTSFPSPIGGLQSFLAPRGCEPAVHTNRPPKLKQGGKLALWQTKTIGTYFAL